MQVVYPEYWIWALGLPASIGIIYLVYRRVAYITKAWFSEDQYARSQPLTKFILRSLGFCLLFLGLMGPFWGSQQERMNALAREFYILLDVSASMNAEDIRPTRLKRVKRELRQLSGKLEGDKIGLILFTENAYVQCPLTLDHDAFLTFLDMAETYQYAQTGTQFRSALAMAMDRFSKSDTTDRNISRSIILISDGEDFGDTYASVIERLKDADIHVFTVGIGSYEGAPVPDTDPSKKGYKRNEDGTTVISRLIDDDLISIANEFNTDFVSLDDPDNN
ncbi:MAG: VWA domain-containing protein, partial [Bacteroidota bacterium]